MLHASTPQESGITRNGDPRLDDLTGLPGRALCDAELAQHIARSDRYGEGFAALYIDVDGLKEANDVYGHSAGDVLIQDTAQILSNTVRLEIQPGYKDRPADYVGRAAFRLGGDEFLIIVAGISTEEQVAAVKERLRQNLAVRDIEASIGGRCHQAGEKLEDFVEAIDTLMLEEKRVRKNQRYETRINQLSLRKRVAHRMGRSLLRYSGLQPPR